jgi:hypothetical protein
MFQLFQSYIVASGFMLQVASVFLCFMSTSHTCCKSMFQYFIWFWSYVAFILQVFYVVRPGASRGPADGARGVPGGRRMRVLQVGARWGVLVLSRSSRLLCVACTESQREEGSGEGPAGAETRLVRTRWWGKGGRGRVARASGHSDVRALATPKKEVSQKKKLPLHCSVCVRVERISNEMLLQWNLVYKERILLECTKLVFSNMYKISI